MVKARFVKLRPGMSADDIIRVYNDTVEKLSVVIMNLESANADLRAQVGELKEEYVGAVSGLSSVVSELSDKVLELESTVSGLSERISFYHGDGSV